MWEISNTAQTVSFLFALVLGLIFCLIYDVLRAIRFAFKISDTVIFFQDIFFFLIISFLSFIFMLALTNGEVRGYIIVGIFLGFFICFFTFSKLFVKFLKFVFLKINGVFRLISKLFYENFAKADIFIRKNLKNIGISIKKGLKKVKRMLYTKK